MALVNGFMLWKIINNSNPNLDHASFNESVAIGLLNLHIGVGTRSKSSTPTKVTRGIKPTKYMLEFDGHSIGQYLEGQGYCGAKKNIDDVSSVRV